MGIYIFAGSKELLDLHVDRIILAMVCIFLWATAQCLSKVETQ